MDIVDSQIHLFQLNNTHEGLAAMNALGIQAALIHEVWGYDGVPIPSGGPVTRNVPAPQIPDPAFALPDGGYRFLEPGSMWASLRHPERFSYVARIHPQDPELAALMRLAKASPHARGLRIGFPRPDDREGLVTGKFDRYFLEAEAADLPVFVIAPGHPQVATTLMERFPQLRVILDHCGMPASPARFDEVLALAKYDNLALKWAHAQSVFQGGAYPYHAVLPFLRRAIDAFGPERLMWASDYTIPRQGETWAESLFYIRDSDALTSKEKDWVLGASARKILNWPRPTSPAPLTQPPLWSRDQGSVQAQASAVSE